MLLAAWLKWFQFKPTFQIYLFCSQKCPNLKNKLFGHSVHSRCNFQHLEHSQAAHQVFFWWMKKVLQTNIGATYYSFNCLPVRSGLLFPLSWSVLKGNWSSINCQVSLWLNLLCEYVYTFSSHPHSQDNESDLLSTCYVLHALICNLHVFNPYNNLMREVEGGAIIIPILQIWTHAVWLQSVS